VCDQWRREWGSGAKGVMHSGRHLEEGEIWNSEKVAASGELA